MDEPDWGADDQPKLNDEKGLDKGPKPAWADIEEVNFKIEEGDLDTAAPAGSNTKPKMLDNAKECTKYWDDWWAKTEKENASSSQMLAEARAEATGVKHEATGAKDEAAGADEKGEGEEEWEEWEWEDWGWSKSEKKEWKWERRNGSAKDAARKKWALRMSGEEDPQKQEMLKLAALKNARYNRVMTRRANAAAEAARKAVQEQHEAAAAAYRATQEAWARVQAEQWAQQQQAAQQYHDGWYYGGGWQYDYAAQGGLCCSHSAIHSLFFLFLMYRTLFLMI